MPKFGFESEWQEGADALTEALHGAGMVGDRMMHRYHCHCPNCSFEESPFSLRVQTDSSCAGEVISSPFTSWPDAVGVMSALQTHALEVDAEPGMNAGFHVHVDMNDTSTDHKANVLWGFALWEPFIMELAKGRFTGMRSMNRSVRRNMSDYYSIEDDATISTRSRAYTWYRELDRHSNLNLRTNYGTIEFRVWNSTRSAWRMELFTRMSVALANRNVSGYLATNAPTLQNSRRTYENVLCAENVERFKTGLRTGRQGSTIDLLDRQLAYITAGRATDMEFTAA